MPRDDSFQRLVDGDEIALRDVFRRYGAAARTLAQRIVDREIADDVVETAFIQIWAMPERWASDALDVHILRLTRDLAHAARRRGIAPSLAIRDLEPFPLQPDPALPDVVQDFSTGDYQRAMLRSPGAASLILEDAWLDASAPMSAGAQSAADLVQAIEALAALLSDTQEDVHQSDDEVDATLGLFAFGLLDEPEQRRIAQQIRRDDTLSRRLSAWPTAAAAITMSTLEIAPAAVEPRLEQRLIQRARLARPPTVHTRQALQVVRRGLIWLALAGVAAVAVVFGVLAFRPDDPIDGRAVALSDDGLTGVLLPHYEDQLFALVFWGLPEPSAGDAWQLWLVRESGAVEAGPLIERSADGRAAVTVNPLLLDSDDPAIGFAVSRDDPAERPADPPSSDDIIYQFSR